MRLTRLAKYQAIALTLLLALVGLTPVDSAKALDGSKFDPGLIISDSVFYDFGTMTVEDIQRFLESQVPECKSGPTGMPCLRNFKADTPEKTAEVGKCAYMPAQKNISAAQIIYNIARACGINPRVLLVILQKEQGLVQATIPSPYMYKAAMGYGCPDSDPAICGKVWVGLFNQLYKAAGQLQWYGDPAGSFTGLRVGRTVEINYHPDAKRNCGKKSFTIKSQATANLYYYTPFVPNEAALRNLRGVGDSCSSYGNRNFWRFYWDWFGSPIGGGFLLKSSTSDPYFISNDVKYPFADKSLVSDLGPLGPLGEISQDYLDSFPTGIPMTRIVKTPPYNGISVYFFISGGKKYVFANCDQATNFGLDCTKAVELTRVQLDAMPTGQFRPDIKAVVKSKVVAPATPSYFLITDTKKYPLDCAKAINLGFDCTKAVEYTQQQLDALATIRLSLPSLGISAMLTDADGARVLIQNGMKREVLDDASLNDIGITAIAPSPLKVKDFAYLPWGAPIALDSSLFVNRATKREGVLVDGKFFDIDPATRADIDFTKLFRQTTGTLGADGLSGIPSSGVIKSLITDESGQEWILTTAGKVKVTDTSDWTKQSSSVSNLVADKFATIADTTIDGFNYVKSDSDKTIYLLKDGLARPTFNAADRTKLGVGMTSSEIVSLPPSSFALLPQGVMVLPAGTVVKNRTTKVVGVIDGDSRMVVFGPNSAKLAVPPFRRLSNLQLVGYSDQEVINPFKVSCSKQVYVAVNSLLYETPIATAKEIPGKATALSDATCALLTITDQSFGHYVGLKVKNPTTGRVTSKAYKIVKGKLHPFASYADYKKDNLTDPPLVWVDESFINNFALGKEIDLAAPVTPSPKPTSKPKTYTIVAGDSLSSVAAKYGTTVARLMEINGIVNADRIRIGQVLKLP